MRHFLARLTAVLLVLSTASCSGDGPDFIWLRAMHAISDGPTIRVTYDQYVFRRNLDFNSATTTGAESLLSGASPTTTMTADFLHPGNQLGGTLLTRDVPIEKDSITTVVLAGSFAAPETITVVTPRRQRPLGSLYFQFAHATPALGALDVYVTEPDTELTGTAPITSIAPLGASGSFEVPFGATRIRLTAAGSFDTVFDSGELDFAESTGPLGPGAEWLFAVSPSLAAGPSPVNLIGSFGTGGATLRDTNTPATMRAFHASPDAPEVDLIAETDTEELLFGPLAYRARSPLVPTPTGEFKLGFRLAGQSGEPFATVDSILAPGGEFAAFLVEPLDTARILLRETQSRSIATMAKLRFAHLSEDSEFFIAYLTDSADAPLEVANRILVDLRFGQVTDHISRLPGEHFLTLTRRFYETADQIADAEETVVFGPMPVELLGGDVVTYAIYPPETEGETEVLELFDDLAP